MKKVINLFIVVFVIGCIPITVYADPISIDVPSSCTVTDTVGTPHTFPQSDSPGTYLGICMLEAAKEAGLVDFTLTNDPSFGLYIQSVNSVAPGATEYWAIWSNGVMAACGIGCIPLSQDDSLSFVLTDWMTNVESSTVAFQVHSLIPLPSPLPPSLPPSSGAGERILHKQLNIPNALAYLVSKQNADGSFDAPFLNDWVALAFAAQDPGLAKVKLHDYLLTATTTLSSITDYERHALALEALGINPYASTSIDSITPIVRAFDGVQIGDAHLDNDDIFALFPLLHAGYSTNDPLIASTTAFILSAQQTNGSWDDSVDMTAAAAQALAQVRSLPNVSKALAGAETYLRGKQQKDGRFGNSFSTSWALQAMGVFGGSTPWAPTGYYATDYLADLQQADGGIEPVSTDTQTRVWATAYAIPAIFGQSWTELLHSFAKQDTIIQAPLAATSSVAITVRHAEPKVEIAPLMPTLIDIQGAAAAAAPTGNTFNHLWDTLTKFFSRWL